MENIPPHEHAKIINQHTKDGFGFTLVTCGNCGKILSRPVDHVGALTCEGCKRTDEEYTFPDLFY